MKNVILVWFLSFKSAHFCEQRLRLVSALKHKKYEKIKKVERGQWKKLSKIWSRSSHTSGHVSSPRKMFAGHVFGHVQRDRYMAHNVTEFPGHITTWPINHLAMFVATFVVTFRCVRDHVSVTFRSCSWPRYIHIRGHVTFMFGHVSATFKTRFLKFFSVFFERVLKSDKCD